MTEMNLSGLLPWGGLAGDPIDGADIVVAGIPYDGSAVYRKGAALAPKRIRELSAVMPPVTEDARPLAGLRVHDMGDLDAGTDIEAGWSKVANGLAKVPASALLTVLGGDHCTAIATLTTQRWRHPDLAVLWVDAHPDLCDFSRGGRWTCGCAMRRALEVSSIGPARVVIAGGRDYDPEELEFIRARGMLLVSASQPSTRPLLPARRSHRPAGSPPVRRSTFYASPPQTQSWWASTSWKSRRHSTTGTSRLLPL